jgi:hypothetical protein
MGTKFITATCQKRNASLQEHTGNMGSDLSWSILSFTLFLSWQNKKVTASFKKKYT